MKTGWEVKALGDVALVIAGQSPKSSAYNEKAEGLPFYQGKKDYGDRFLKPPTKWTTQITKEAEAGDILMSVRAPVGPLNEATETICIGRGLAAIRPKAEVERAYLWYALTWLEPTVSGSEGAVFASINKAGIEALSIPLPPLEEQKEIVAVLDAAFEGLTRARAHIETNLQNARELFAALLLGFQKQGDTVWSESDLEKLVTDDCTLSYGIVQPGDEVANGLPIVRPTDLGEREILIDGLKRIDPEKSNGYARTVLQGGELLLCVRGTTGTIGIASPELKGANVTRGIVPIRFHPAELLQRFGYYAFISSPVKKQIAEATYGAALQQINIRDVRKLRFSYPEINEQKVILDALDIAFDQAELMQTHYRAKLQDLDDLRQSLLQRAFAGELT